MTFGDAVKSVLSQYANFSGRARRSEYWWFVLFYVIVAVVASIIDTVLSGGILIILAALALILPSLAVGVRRLHDTGKSGWFILISLVPFIGSLILLIFMATDGNPETNQYGPSPKAA
jgi:uncharacterized membrane protein YhaH (DUF805 family)